jgi:hypothetical protein
MEKQLDTPYVHYHLVDGVLIGTFKKGLKINLEIAKEIVKNRLALTGDGPFPSIIINMGVFSIDKKGRDYLASTEGIRGLNASAVVLDSPFGSLLGNFFIRVTKPKLPVKVFRTKAGALNWVEQFKKK